MLIPDDHRINTFLATFPSKDPAYVILVTIDEPQPEEGAPSATAGRNAAPMTGRILKRIGSMLALKSSEPGTQNVLQPPSARAPAPEGPLRVQY